MAVLGFGTRCGLLFALVLECVITPYACAQQINEYQMKAAYLYNFAKFVEWPAQAFKNPHDPISICVLGQNPMFHTLEEVVNGETIEDRKLIVRTVSDLDQVSNCHILYIGSSDRKYLRAILRDFKVTGILTVGEAEGFAAEGGVANFKLEGNKVRIEINTNAAEEQRLRISPKLLSLAQIVKGKGAAK
jgi:hypothetical protein